VRNVPMRPDDDPRATFYRAALLLAGTTWHLFLSFPSPDSGAATFTLVLGVAPYLVLIAASYFVRHWAVLLLATFLQVVADIQASILAMNPASSTNGVALLIQPIISLAVLIPGLLIVLAVQRLFSSPK
jgi:hypothetical protein